MPSHTQKPRSSATLLHTLLHTLEVRLESLTFNHLFKGRVSQTTNKMASHSTDGRFYIAADASEMTKIDKALRLPGLQFPKKDPVLGKKQAGAMLALAAFDAKRNRAGKQLVVVQRLCVLYNALLNTHKDHPALDINGDTFYEAALDNISKTNKDSIAKYLTPASLRHVVAIYRKAFHYGGLKPKKTDLKGNNGAQETTPVQPGISPFHVARPNGNGGEAFIGERLMWPSQSIEQKSARVKLQELVKEWIIARGITRRNKATAKEPQTIDSPHAEQPQGGQSAKTHELGLQPASEYDREERDPREEGSTELLKKEREVLEKELEMLERETKVIEKENEALEKENSVLKERFQLIERKCLAMEQHISRVDRSNDTTSAASEIDIMDRLLSEIEDDYLEVLELPPARSCGF